MIESSDRAAWTQYEDNGMGSGLNAYKHKQPSHKGRGEKERTLQRDYYVRSKGKA